MSERLNLGIIGDYDQTYTLHLATNSALTHSGQKLGLTVQLRWLATAQLDDDLDALEDVDALLCSPGSPYASISGALSALRFGRERGIPTLGTCGGCQHMILEYARNVLQLSDAQHAEYEPDADEPIVSELTCSLVGRTGTVTLDEASRVGAIYGVKQVQEQYFCSFGVNPRYEASLEQGGLRIVGRDADDAVARVFELPSHPFYVATLFVPQARSSETDPHPLLVQLLRAAAESRAATTATLA